MPEHPHIQGNATPFGNDAIWAPWRLPYLEGLAESENPPGVVGSGPRDPGDTFLSDYWKHPERDAQNHVIVRDAHGMILLNRYPYANGHLLVALGDARPTLLDYDEAQRAALWRLVDRAMALMQRVLEPQGVNIGVNQGRAAGAGVPGHLHVHLVPRWGGDTNFMHTVGRVRVIPASLDAVYARYRESLG
ncbi:MAG: HIT domain-containing protein [Planctomycetota bacterium]|nr:MAG: HIT domain-containing protein [Planctomycetota bacterium]